MTETNGKVRDAEVCTRIPDHDDFSSRHIGPSNPEIDAMLQVLGCSSLQELSDKIVPHSIRLREAIGSKSFSKPLSESEALSYLSNLAVKNRVSRSYIGMGYYGTITPPVIQRNILENPGWYTQYTPYQAEIAQGRLEALLNFQTLVSDLTALPIANASLLDEGTAAAEAMAMCYSRAADNARVFFVSNRCHPQTLALLQTRAEALGIEVSVGDPLTIKITPNVFGVLLQYPDTDGDAQNLSDVIKKLKAMGAAIVVATDLLALTLLVPPGELGADIAVGSAQRFGVPIGFGGPHAAFLSCTDDFKRVMPGRLIGVSKDSAGQPALRLSLQTREQHIRREKATSNICTAQVLLAVMASMYAVYHGPHGLRRIADRVHYLTRIMAGALSAAGTKVRTKNFFDTLKIALSESEATLVLQRAEKHGVVVRSFDKHCIGVSLDEVTQPQDLVTLMTVLTGKTFHSFDQLESSIAESPLRGLTRSSQYLTHAVFNSYHSETEFLRYLKRLESRDLSLAVSMIPLGSCTMKLNATSEMLPVTWKEFSALHPFAPTEHTAGYRAMFSELEEGLAKVTGFTAVSLQPNAGSQGEYAGLLAIRAYHKSRNELGRNICLIPKSAHGTNPASAVMAGFKVVVVECDQSGNIDLGDLGEKAKQHASELAALMVTYPSTHGVFEEAIKEICEIVHNYGGQVYMDGANLNALVGLCRPSDIGADVCHINLHKTFCIPHGGGGPGMGPIAVRTHLAPFLPGHPLAERDTAQAEGCGPVSAAPWGSASILPISWMYMKMMGEQGLKKASQVAILNANYIANRLRDYYPLLYSGKGGFIAHECILDLRSLKHSAGVEVEDVAKRLMDYGFHAPTVSWPVPGTIMVEPTESESKAELDRFCDAMIAIRNEIKAVEEGRSDRANNPLKNAPHTAQAVVSDSWSRPYTRQEAAFPAEWTKQYKFWPAVGRIDNVFGDRNLVCTCSGWDA